MTFFFKNLLWNYWAESYETSHRCSLGYLVQKLSLDFWTVKTWWPLLKIGHRRQTGFLHTSPKMLGLFFRLREKYKCVTDDSKSTIYGKLSGSSMYSHFICYTLLQTTNETRYILFMTVSTELITLFLSILLFAAFLGLSNSSVFLNGT